MSSNPTPNFQPPHGAAADTARRLFIDARPNCLGPVDPGRDILGLPVLTRLVRAAERSGFTDIHVAGERTLEPLLAGTRAVRVDPDQPPPEDAAVAPASYLGETSWLSELAAAPGDARRVRFQTPPFDLATSPDPAVAEKRLLAALTKETDGFMSRRFARPISLTVSRFLAPRGVTPNQMTLVSALIGLIAAPFFLFESPALQTIGGALFVLHSVLDGCDGELARLGFKESRLGGLLDFWGDNLVHVAVFAAMGIGWGLAEDAAWPLYLALSAAAVHWFTLSGKSGTGPVYTSVSGGAPDRLSKLMDDLSRRDFIYLVFVLALFGKASWFLALTAVGAPVFLILILALAARKALAERRTRAA